MRKRSKTTKAKTHRAAYNSTPTAKAKKKVAAAEYYKTPQGKAKIKAYQNSPKAKAKAEEYRKSPKYKARINSPLYRTKRVAKWALRRARKIKQTPILTTIEKQQIVEIYSQCREISKSTGIPHHVDHIIPLSKQGDHHPNNLQILTAAENMKKGARTTVTQEFCPSP